LALNADGSVIGWGYNQNSETALPSEFGRHALAVAAGAQFSLVVTDDSG
jgi:hypothetical protein